MKTNVDIFSTNPISGKILVLELWAEILLANQTAGFFKMQYLKIDGVIDFCKDIF